MKMCELTGSEPGIISASFQSKRLDMRVHLLVSKKSFQLVHQCGGIDEFLRQTTEAKLTKKAARLRWEIVRRYR
jgi:ribosomal protein L28